MHARAQEGETARLLEMQYQVPTSTTALGDNGNQMNGNAGGQEAGASNLAQRGGVLCMFIQLDPAEFDATCLSNSSDG